MITKTILPLSFFSILCFSYLPGLQMDGYAIVSSVDKHNKYHMTLTHVQTPHIAIAKKVEKLVLKFIATNYPITHNHCHLSWISDLGKREMWGKNSLKMGGEVETFKQALHDHLAANKKIGKFIAPYRIAHVNIAGDKNAPLYKQVRVDDIYLMPVYKKQ
ncbi:MAG: hypothetical protein H0W50_11100 [Parachlamydiaceae bacterium]|nr:hypothetical protein [Parachlamydiaceae bacterium]